MNYPIQQSQATIPAAPVPPGWYPDPSGQAAERYWDGIGWSADFVRPFQAQPAGRQYARSVGQAAPGLSPQQSATRQSAGPEYRQLGLPGGMVWMLLGAILTLVRVVYVSGQWDSYSQGGAYNTGALVGAGVGFLIGGILIGHGYYQYRDWVESPTVKPPGRLGFQVMPVAIPVAAVAFVLAWLMH